MRILVATVPLTGHVQPMRAVVAELAARGHDLTWTTGAKFAGAVTEAGARFAPMQIARDWDDAAPEEAFPSLRRRRGLARVKQQLREMFIAPMIDQLRDLERIASSAPAPPDAVLADSAHLGAQLYAERHGITSIGLGVSALMFPSVDTAPFGSALAPSRVGPRGNRFLNWLVFRVLFGAVNRAFRAQRRAAGLPASNDTYFAAISRDLFLQPTVAAFEYPRRDLPAQVRFAGPLLPPPAHPHPLPAWWPDVLAAQAAGTPIALVTQGTLATDPRELIQPALAALADRPMLVVVTNPHVHDALPANARAAAFVPYAELLPRVAVMITNGGYGGVQMALAHGVPLVVAGGSEEKPEIAARVAWSGAGIDLRTGTPRPRAIAAAVSRVLADPSFRTRAAELQRTMATLDAPRVAADAIEEVVRR